MIYIALLRAVNVGGRTVKMDQLRAVFTALGLNDVGSYIQSGNVFFETDAADRMALAQAIETRLEQSLGFNVPVFLRTLPELEESLALHPFDDVEVTPMTRLSVVFTSAPLVSQLVLPHFSPKRDIEIRALTTGEAFAVLRQAEGRPSNPTAYIEQSFGVRATARFYATTVKIVGAARGL